MMEDRQVVDLLNELIVTCKDGEYGFATCAERLNAPERQELMRKRAAGCAAAARELQSLVVRLGGEPIERGSVLGAMHRGWVSVKDVLTADSDHAVLAECERGEHAALERYEAALAADLPLAIREVLERQCEGVRSNHARVREMRDRAIT